MIRRIGVLVLEEMKSRMGEVIAFCNSCEDGGGRRLAAGGIRFGVGGI